MANYIKTLEHSTAAQAAELEALYSGIRDLVGYLISEKFDDDPTVQTADVIRRIGEVTRAAGDAGESA
jgi:hypothetical protein